MKKIQTERPHLFAPNIGVSINVRITGDPSDEQIKAAVSKAVLCNESLSSKIILQDGAAFYEKTAPDYQVCSSGVKWTELVEAFPWQSLDIFNGEMVRFYIIRNMCGLQLLMIGHHLAGDGLSFVFLAEDIMRALNGEPLQYKPLQVLDAGALPKRSGIPFITKRYLKRLNNRWYKSGRVFDPRDYHRLHNEYARNYNGCVMEHELDEDATEGLIQFSRKMGITVNTLFVTALLKEYKETATVGVAVSVRDSDDRGMTNWVSGIDMSYRYDSKMDFAANARTVRLELKNMLTDKRKKYFVLHFLTTMDGALLDSVCMAKYLGFSNPESEKLASLMFYTENQRDLGVTNLTRAMIPVSYGKYSIAALGFAPPVVPYCKRTLGMITFNNKMTVTMNTIAEDKSKERDFFNRVTALLSSSFGTQP